MLRSIGKDKMRTRASVPVVGATLMIGDDVMRCSMAGLTLRCSDEVGILRIGYIIRVYHKGIS